MSEGKRSGWDVKKEYLDWIIKGFIAVLVTITLFIISGTNQRLANLNDKVFNHITNESLHPTKSMVVKQSEYNTYKEMMNYKVGRIIHTLEKFDKRIGELNINIPEYKNK